MKENKTKACFVERRIVVTPGARCVSSDAVPLHFVFRKF